MPFTVTSRTTLSQRFQKAIEQNDLELAQRIATRAFGLQTHRRPSAYKALEPPGVTSPVPSKAALRAARAQRPSSTNPFDIRNVEPVCDTAQASRQHHHHHHWKYSLAAPEPSSFRAGTCTESSLILAIKSHADIEMVQWLLEMGHEHRGPSIDVDTNTVLHLAALYDRADIIQPYIASVSRVLSSITDLVDAQTLQERRSALHIACIKGFEDVARQLIDLGAHLDLQDRGGNTALHFASAWGHLPLVHLLFERGCSPALPNEDGSTATDHAFSHSIKTALELCAKSRLEKRKERRPTAPGNPQTYTGDNRAQPDRPHGDEFRARSKSFAPSSGHPPAASITERSADTSSLLYSDWTPEKTFAQPGQNLFPNTRGFGSSPPVPQGGSSSIQWGDKPDLYGDKAPSPRSMAALPSQVEPNVVVPVPTTPINQQHWPSSATPNPQSGLTPHTQTSLHTSPNRVVVHRTPSPNLFSVSNNSEIADKVRMQDAAAMSLFRSATPQAHMVPGRIDTPPLAVPSRGESPFSISGRSIRTDKSPRSRRAELADPTTHGSSSGTPPVPSKD